MNDSEAIADEREALARLIDADAWREPILPEGFKAMKREASEYRADAILSSGWLAEHDRQVAEKAWGEGADTALDFAKRNPDGVTLRLEKPNPYRKEDWNE